MDAKRWMVVVCAAMVGVTGCSGDDPASSEASSSGEPSGGEELNGCDVSTAEDHTGEGAVVVATEGFAYSPACVRISAGTKVTIGSNFASHPLKSGDAATGEVDEASPITPTATGTSAEFTFSAPGAYGFYCDLHKPPMAGAIFVE